MWIQVVSHIRKDYVELSLKMLLDRLALVGRNTEALDKIKGDCQAAGAGDVIVLSHDLSEEKQCQLALTETINHFKCLDVLVHSAGILINGGIENLSVEDYDKEHQHQVRLYHDQAVHAPPHLQQGQHGSRVQCHRPPILPRRPRLLCQQGRGGHVSQVHRPRPRHQGGQGERRQPWGHRHRGPQEQRDERGGLSEVSGAQQDHARDGEGRNHGRGCLTDWVPGK